MTGKHVTSRGPPSDDHQGRHVGESQTSRALLPQDRDPPTDRYDKDEASSSYFIYDISVEGSTFSAPIDHLDQNLETSPDPGARIKFSTMPLHHICELSPYPLPVDGQYFYAFPTFCPRRSETFHTASTDKWFTALFQAKEGATQAELDEFFAIAKSMQGQIDGILSIEGGHALGAPAVSAKFNQGFDWVLVVMLDKPEHLSIYEQHPAHTKYACATVFRSPSLFKD